MELAFEYTQQLAPGHFPDVVHYANNQAQALYVKSGQLYGAITDTPLGDWGNRTFENELLISPDSSIQNFRSESTSGFGIVACYKNGDTHKMLIYEFCENDYRNHVQYQNKVEVRTADETVTAYLTPQADAIKDCSIDTRLNGESTLEFLLPANSKKVEYLSPECYIYAGWKAYMLRKDEAIDTIRDEKNALWTKVMAVERWAELDASFIEPSISNDPTIPSPSDLAVIIVGGGSNVSDNKFVVGTAAHALYAVLKGSGWHLGVCDVDGIHDLEMEKVSRLELIKQIQNIWGGYLDFDSVNKIVHLRDPNKWQHYAGFQFRYAKNLKHITRTQSNRLITKLYVFGHDDLDIAAVNNGKKYITDFSYTSREYVGTYKNQDIYNQAELIEKARAELSLNCRPRYLYKVKILDLRSLPEYSHEDFFYGQMADVVDPDVAPDTPQTRIIRHKYDHFQPWKCEIDIGDPQERLIEKLKAAFETSSFIDTKYKGNGQSSGYSIEDLTIEDAKIKNLSAEKIIADSVLINVRMSVGSGNNIFKVDRKGIYLGNADFDDAPFSVDMQGNLNAINAYIQGDITGSTISGSTINGGIINGSIINTDRDITVGDNIYMAPTFMGGIKWDGLDIEIYVDPAAESLQLWAAGGVYVNGEFIG